MLLAATSVIRQKVVHATAVSANPASVVSASAILASAILASAVRLALPKSATKLARRSATRLATRLAIGANSACYAAADEAMKGKTPVGNCLYFRTVVPEINGQIIGGHVFY